MGVTVGQILAEEHKFSNAVGDGGCEDVYDSGTQKQYFNCREAYQLGSKSVAAKYEQALLNGYSGTFKEWKEAKLDQVQSTAGSLVDFGKDIFGRFKSPSDSGSTGSTNSKQAGMGWIVPVTLLAIVGIGAGIYYYKNTK
jgi:hypothetical protein